MKLNHHRVGSGPPLLLIHGTGSQWQIWEPVIERLADCREVVAVDLPGFGASPPLPAGDPTTPEALAKVVLEVVAELGLERPHVAGNSNGAWIALEIAKLGFARSVVGISPMGLWKDTVPPLLEHPIVISRKLSRLLLPWYEVLWSRRWLRSIFMSSLVGRPLAMPAEVSLASVENLAYSPGFMPAVSGVREAGRFSGGERLDIPVTLTFSSRDLGVRMRYVKRHADVPEHTRWVTLHGCGHVPFFDDPDLVAGTLLEATEEI